MASYPASVKTFTTKNAGDTIQPAHVNDMQDEITAIEDGLLNGSAPVNSSRLTAASLSVAGASTLASLTLSTTLSVTRVGCRLTHSAAQNVPTGTETGLNWDTERSDVAGMHSTATNSSRISFPVAGFYLIGGSVQWGNSASGSARSLRVRLNDGNDIGFTQTAATSSGTIVQSIATGYAMSTSDYVTLTVAHDIGSTTSISVAATYSPEFWAALVGA